MIPIGAYRSWQGLSYEGRGIEPDLYTEWSMDANSLAAMFSCQRRSRVHEHHSADCPLSGVGRIECPRSNVQGNLESRQRGRRSVRRRLRHFSQSQFSAPT